MAPRPPRKVYAPRIEDAFSAVPTIPKSVVTSSKKSSEGRRTSAGPRMAPNVTQIVEGGEDDIPVSIRNSFKELRSVKDELERQVRAVLPFLVHSQEPSR
jgi:hypothetical protein